MREVPACNSVRVCRHWHSSAAPQLLRGFDAAVCMCVCVCWLVLLCCSRQEPGAGEQQAVHGYLLVSGWAGGPLFCQACAMQHYGNAGCTGGWLGPGSFLLRLLCRARPFSLQG